MSRSPADRVRSLRRSAAGWSLSIAAAWFGIGTIALAIFAHALGAEGPAEGFAVASFFAAIAAALLPRETTAPMVARGAGAFFRRVGRALRFPRKRT